MIFVREGVWVLKAKAKYTHIYKPQAYQEVAELRKRIAAGLERVLGRKTAELEIFKVAEELGYIKFISLRLKKAAVMKEIAFNSNQSVRLVCNTLRFLMEA